jgi:hypothetical protein
MKRLNIFIKGNVDLHDSLMYSRINGRIEWNGINAALEERQLSYVARVRHEPCARWDQLGIEGVTPPAALSERQLPLGAFTLDTQFRSNLLAAPADVVVLSVQSDVMNRLARHRRAAYQFLAAGSETWATADQRWLEDEFDLPAAPCPTDSFAQLGRVVTEIRKTAAPSILVFNMSAAVPGDSVSSYRGLADALSTRIRAYNLGLVEAAATLDLGIVDVDLLTARAGADHLKLDGLHFNCAGLRLIAAETVRQIEARGHFD